jgi:1,4-alpha-glucan branching enzyme
MNSNIEKFIKGESKNAFSYFGAHKVNDGVCFRLYAPHAKSVEVVTGGQNHKMERIDFRGVYEVRVKDVREFDSYTYEILTNDNVWVTKNDPYTFYQFLFA